MSTDGSGREGAGTGVSAGEGPTGRGRLTYPESVERLIAEFARLPGIGRRSAERLAMYVLVAEGEGALGLARAIEDVKARVRRCRVCSNLSDGEVCGVCVSPARDRSAVLVVEQARDLIALEQTGMYRGVYHVLLGRISPLDGVGPGDLTVGDLLARVSDPARNAGGVPVREVILGLNPTVEGDGTGLYIAEQLRALPGPPVRVSRLARGLPSGSTLEHANKAVLSDAIEGRQGLGD